MVKCLTSPGDTLPTADGMLLQPEAQQTLQGKVLPGSDTSGPPAEVLEFESQLTGQVSAVAGVVDELPLNEKELMSSMESGFQVTLFMLYRSELRNIENFCSIFMICD